MTKPLPTKQTGFPRGVYQTKPGTAYKAKAYRQGKTIYIGSYPTIAEASQAYKDFVAAHPRGKMGPLPTTLFKRKPLNDFTGTWLNGL